MTSPNLMRVFAACLALAACAPQTHAPNAALVGAWRSHVQFTSGPFAPVRDLDFMYAFHPDGTLLESSNYDAAPPVPPAYGVWRQTAPGQFEAHYEFFTTQPPARGGDLSGGWAPLGRGVLTETISLAADGKSFTSRLHLVLLDAQGAPTGDTGDAETQGVRIDFP